MKMPPLAKVADICLILVCLGMGAATADRWWRNPSSQGDSIALPSAAAKLLALEGVDTTQAARTLILYLSTECQYCNESAPFYAEIVRNRKNSDLHLIAMSREPRQTLTEYLDSRGVNVDAVIQVPPNYGAVRGTPTLIVADRERRILGVWQGLLGVREQQVRRAILQQAKS